MLFSPFVRTLIGRFSKALTHIEMKTNTITKTYVVSMYVCTQMGVTYHIRLYTILLQKHEEIYMSIYRKMNKTEVRGGMNVALFFFVEKIKVVKC